MLTFLRCHVSVTGLTQMLVSLDQQCCRAEYCLMNNVIIKIMSSNHFIREGSGELGKKNTFSWGEKRCYTCLP